MAESKLGTNSELIIRHTWANKERETRIKTTIINIIDTRYLREKKSNVLTEHNTTEFPSFLKEGGNQYVDTEKNSLKIPNVTKSALDTIMFHV